MRTCATCRRFAGIYLLLAILLATALLANTVHAQNTTAGAAGDGGMTYRHYMGRMSHACEAASNGGMATHRCRGQGMHGMMGRAFLASAAAAVTEPARPTSTSTVMTAEEGAQTGAPASFLAALASADRERGRQLALTNGCAGCHSLQPGGLSVGPTWYDLAETAATRVPGQGAADYLYTSIVQPNAYVVAGYLPGIMAQNYGQRLSEDDIADIVRYLLTLDGE
jgi:mono/diheme cytochrome c family protein